MLTVEYDGSAFCGFQRQPNGPSIHSEIEKALSVLFAGKTKIQAASGRTDSGVHAVGQVVNFKTGSLLSLERIQKGLNGLLPRAIAVRSVRRAAPDFHARYSARSKCYEYLIWNHAVRSPLRAARTWHVPYALDLGKMRAAAARLKGRHDFRSFCASDASSADKNTVRNVRQLTISQRENLIRIRVSADGFLYKMVRNLAGTLVEAGLGKMTAAEAGRILKARDRKQAGRTAPAHGLCLLSVTY